MATQSIVAFWVVAVLLIVVPGADWAFTISAGLRGESVLPAVGGLALGYTAMTVVVAGGVGALVAGSPNLLTGLTCIGGVYLIWHGVTTFTHPAAAPTPPPMAPASAGTPMPASISTDWDLLVRGIGVSALNPKGLLIFVALLPQFTDPHGSWPLAGQIGLLGLAFTITCAAFYLCLGLFAQTILLARPAAAKAVSQISSAAMIAIGLALLADRLWHG